MESKIDFYCVVSALLSLDRFLDRICKDERIKALAVDFLDPSMPHFQTTQDAAWAIERAASLFSIQDFSIGDALWVV